MAATRMATSPISKMNDDSLLWIFHIISRQMPDRHRRLLLDDATSWRSLEVIRAASQVCHGWRELLLSSPVIWGRVVDLGADDRTYGRKRLEWMEEVVRRAGSAPLWISGKVAPPTVDFTYDSQAFFVDLLQAWERIERISVDIHGRIVPQAIQSRFLLPAPILKWFHVDFHHRINPLFLDTLQPDSSQQLFGNYAPSLEVIKVEKMAINPNAPWLSGIREIIPVPTMLSMHDIFVMLQHTPALESIVMTASYHFCVGIYPPSVKPNLPNLSSIRLNTSFWAASRILSYISPGELSVLQFHLLDLEPHLADDYGFSAIQKNLPLYIASHLVPNPLAEVRLEFAANYFGFSQVCYVTKHSPYGQLRDFHITMDISGSRSEIEDDNIMTCLNNAMLKASTLGGNQPLFESVVGMDLYFSPPPSSNRYPSIYSTLSLFNNIQYIRVNEHSCEILWRISCHDEHDRVLFPKLHTVFLTLDRDGCSMDVFTGLKQFLRRRKKIGVPVGKLDLTAFSKSDYSHGVRSLLDFTIHDLDM